MRFKSKQRVDLAPDSVCEADIFIFESVRIHAERLSQSEIGLPLRLVSYYPHLKKWESSPTKINFRKKLALLLALTILVCGYPTRSYAETVTETACEAETETVTETARETEKETVAQTKQETEAPTVTSLKAPVITTAEANGLDITLTWKSVKQAVRYRVLYRKDGEDWLVAGDTAECTYTLTALENNTRYFFTVQCVDEKGNAQSKYLESNKDYILGVVYLPYTGVDYTLYTYSPERLKAMDYAKDMVCVCWTAPCDFVSWSREDGKYIQITALDGTVSDHYVKGKSYRGVPYSLNNKGTTSLKQWESLLESGNMTSEFMSCMYKEYPNPVTAIGICCFSFVYRVLRASGVADDLTNMRTGSMIASGLYEEIPWYELEPGDLIMKYGHTMIFVGWTEGGNPAIFDSAIGASATQYLIKDFDALKRNDYKAYRYVNLAPSVTHVKTTSATKLRLTYSKNRAILRWDSKSTSYRYYVQYRVNNGGWKTLGYTTNNRMTNVQKDGDFYEYRVRCVRKDGRSAPSAWSNTVSRMYLKRPLISRAVNYKGKLWTGWFVRPSASGYHLQLSTSENFMTNVTSVYVKSTNQDGKLRVVPYHVFSKIKSGKTYYLRLRVYKNYSSQNKYSSWSDVVTYKAP